MLVFVELASISKCGLTDRGSISVDPGFRFISILVILSGDLASELLSFVKWG